jgi:hypothetical protein
VTREPATSPLRPASAGGNCPFSALMRAVIKKQLLVDYFNAPHDSYT